MVSFPNVFFMAKRLSITTKAVEYHRPSQKTGKKQYAKRNQQVVLIFSPILPKPMAEPDWLWFKLKRERSTKLSHSTYPPLPAPSSSPTPTRTTTTTTMTSTATTTTTKTKTKTTTKTTPTTGFSMIDNGRIHNCQSWRLCYREDMIHMYRSRNFSGLLGKKRQKPKMPSCPIFNRIFFQL